MIDQFIAADNLYTFEPIFLQYVLHGVPGCDGIRDDGDMIAAIERAEGGIVYAIGGINAGQIQIIHLIVYQQLLKLLIRERICSVLFKIIVVD